MVWLDGTKDDHMKMAFHEEQVTGKSIVKEENGGEKGAGACFEPLEQAKLTLQSI